MGPFRRPEEHLEAHVQHQDMEQRGKTVREQFEEDVLACAGIMNDLYDVKAKVSEYREELAKVRKFPVSEDPWLDIQGSAQVPKKYPYLCQMIANLEVGLYEVETRNEAGAYTGLKRLLKDIPCPFAHPEPPLPSREASLGSTIPDVDLAKPISTAATSIPDSHSNIGSTAPSGRMRLPLKLRKKQLEDMERCRKVLRNIEGQLDSTWERILAGEFCNDEDKIMSIAKAIRASLGQQLASLPQPTVDQEREVG
ncbi:hypothetical protein QFC20_006616 [Naganishia adeliensis]|uniref:Uncharacterized protein n=1 Tax=Naganishia adeliensis TaxID=92952 RepID=A0ACC2V8S7_9TREE|nr:hypothetical protein QFC20_006616 [Naganishia adeliensis]